MIVVECDGCKRSAPFTDPPAAGMMQWRIAIPHNWFYRYCVAQLPLDFGHGRMELTDQCVFLLACNKLCQTLAVEKAKLRYPKFRQNYDSHKGWLGGPDR